MKILFVSEAYLPGKKAGGPVKSLSSLIQNLPVEFEPFVLTSNRDTPNNDIFKEIETNTWYKLGRASVMYIEPSDFTSSFFEEFVNKNNFDILYFNSFLQNFTVKAYKFLLNEKNRKIIIATRGELSKGALNQKRLKKSIFLFIYKYFLFNEKYYFHFTDIKEKEDFERILKKINNYYVLPNFVLKPEVYNNKNKDSNLLKIVSISRILPMKNLFYSINVLKNCKSDIIFDIYGPVEDQNYWEKCKQLIEKLPQNIKVCYRGALDPNEVTSVYTKYDAFLSPTLGENFGHSIFEGMSVGCVPIISNRTPWTGLEKMGIGWDIPLENADKFSEVIDYLALMEDRNFSAVKTKLVEFSEKKIEELNKVDGLKKMFSKNMEA
ncbi:glycosyltransferase [Enterococcus hirae]|nr:glycosyltransferase [Enterococcus hirae]